MEQQTYSDYKILVDMTEYALAIISDLRDDGYTIDDLYSHFYLVEMGLKQIMSNPLDVLMDYPRLTNSVIREFKGDLIMWIK